MMRIPTFSEDLAAATLVEHRVGLDFEPEYKIGPYHLDFYQPLLKLAFELDGIFHQTQFGQNRDSIRDTALTIGGIKVVRIKSALVLRNPAKFKDKIQLEIKIRLAEILKGLAPGMASSNINESDLTEISLKSIHAEEFSSQDPFTIDGKLKTDWVPLPVMTEAPSAPLSMESFRVSRKRANQTWTDDEVSKLRSLWKVGIKARLISTKLERNADEIKTGLRAIEWVNSARFSSVEVGQHAGQDLEAQVFFVS